MKIWWWKSRWIFSDKKMLKPYDKNYKLKPDKSIRLSWKFARWFEFFMRF
jgi:hypothetical protein